MQQGVGEARRDLCLAENLATLVAPRIDSSHLSKEMPKTVKVRRGNLCHRGWVAHHAPNLPGHVPGRATCSKKSKSEQNGSNLELLAT